MFHTHHMLHHLRLGACHRAHRRALSHKARHVCGYATFHSREYGSSHRTSRTDPGAHAAIVP